MATNDKTAGDRVFWSMAIILSIAGLIYLSVYSLVNKSLLIGILAIVFTGMWAGALVLGFYVGRDYDILNYGTLFGNVLWFSIGFLLYLGINLISLNSTGSMSVFSVSGNQLYATVSSEIPANIDFLMSVFIIPIVEELLWIFGIPVALLTIMNSVKKKVKIFGNPFVQLAVIVLIGGYTFAIFHVGKITLIAFVISAIIFRSIMLIAVYSDWNYDWVKFAQITPALALGAHIGNNLSAFGVSNAWSLIVSNFSTTGWIVVLIFASMILVLINGIGQKISEVNS